MSITPERKNEVIADNARSAGDTGSAEVQVAILSERIANLTDHPDLFAETPWPDVLLFDPATDELEGAVAGALEALRRGTDLSPLLLPIRSANWVACDGDRTAAVLLMGAHVDVRLVIDLDADAVVTFAPEERFPSPW